MPSPESFTKNIIVWVDDHPSKINKTYTNMLRKDFDIEVINLTSTNMARSWLKEFRWFLEWMDIKYRLASDMIRKETKEDVFQINKHAGADLLQIVYNEFGLTTKTIIFCGDSEAAKQAVKAKGIVSTRKKNYTITQDQSEFFEFCGELRAEQ